MTDGSLHGVQTSRTIEIVRSVSFSAAVRYQDANLDLAENRELYGSLAQAKGFGFNYRVDVHFVGPIDPMTGMILNLNEIDRWLKDVVDPLDHQHLNDRGEITGLGSKVPTAERLAYTIFQAIEDRLNKEVATHNGAHLKLVRVHEGDGFSAVYRGRFSASST